MMKSLSFSGMQALKRPVFTLLLASVCGALAGAAAGFMASTVVTAGGPEPLRIATSTAPATSVPTSTLFSLVPLERRAATPLVPPAFLKRRASSVASVYRKPKGASLDERTLGDDRLLGGAVALTSDGWFVTTAAVADGLRLADLVIWHGNIAYPVERGVADHLNNTVYLKTTATDLTPPAFAHVQDLQPGAETWLEARSGELVPAIVLAIAVRAASTDSVSSETAARRIVLSTQSASGDKGGAAWDPNGSLVGLIESREGERARLVPASGIAASFASLLASGDIRHALLGVRTVDLASLRVDGERPVPAAGAWIRDDKKTGKPGILRDSPASRAKLKAGDVILRIERDILDGTADLGEILADYRPGTTVTLRILHGTEDTDVQVTLGQTVTSEVMK